MHQVLLTIAEGVNESFISRLGDQAFSIVLLVAFAVWSIRQQQALKAELTKYVSEDRERMFDVIENNTKAMERFTDSTAKK